MIGFIKQIQQTFIPSDTENTKSIYRRQADARISIQHLACEKNECYINSKRERFNNY